MVLKVLFYIFVSCLVIACPRDGKSEPIYGRDYYAVQSKYWNINATLKYRMNGTMATGNLDNTFGEKLDNVRAVIANFKPTYHRVHLINGPCIRNQRCGKYEIGYGYNKSSFDKAVSQRNPKILKYVRDRTALYRTLAGTFLDTTFIVSPELEHDLSKNSWRILADEIRKVWPGVLLSNSPDGGISIERYLGSWIERHGNTPQSDTDISSLDGIDATQINIDAWKARVRNAKIAYVWQGTDNCFSNGWQDPRLRTVCTPGHLLELLAHIIDLVPAPPKFTGKQCKVIKSFKDPEIWKPAAEYASNDPRSYKPVLITSAFRKDSVNVLASTGGLLGKLGYYSNYLNQGNRYYSGYKGGTGQSGYEFQKSAVASSGSPWAFLQQNGYCEGPIITGRRQGNFK